MAIRDTAADTGRMGDGSKPLRTQYLLSQDFGPTTLVEQNDNGGYNDTDIPVGGTPPRQKVTNGSRGIHG